MDLSTYVKISTEIRAVEDTNIDMYYPKQYKLTPDKLDFNIFRRSILDNPSWKGT